MPVARRNRPGETDEMAAQALVSRGLTGADADRRLPTVALLFGARTREARSGGVRPCVPVNGSGVSGERIR